MAQHKSSKAWMHQHVTDFYVQQAKREGFRSRSAYKLQQMARQDRLIRPGMTVVDLGAAPGGWSQVARNLVGPKGRVIAVDVVEMAPVRGVTFIQGDFRDNATLARLEAALQATPVDLVVSDMAPNMSGIAVADQARAVHLAELALEFAAKWLKPGANLLVKTFQGASYNDLRGALGRHFEHVFTRKPMASRGRSTEIYLLGRGRL